jgi:hypothetical protein
MEENNQSVDLETLRRQREYQLYFSRRTFRNGLIATTFLIIIWGIIGHFIPYGNWQLVLNIIMALLTFWFIFAIAYQFYRLRMDWGILAFILTIITWGILVVIVRTIVGLFI